MTSLRILLCLGLSLGCLAGAAGQDKPYAPAPEQIARLEARRLAALEYALPVVNDSLPAMLARWRDAGADAPMRLCLLDNIYEGLMMTRSPAKALKEVKLRIRKLSTSATVQLQDITTVERALPLVDLILNGMVSVDYPFRLTPTPSFFALAEAVNTPAVEAVGMPSTFEGPLLEQLSLLNPGWDLTVSSFYRTTYLDYLYGIATYAEAKGHPKRRIAIKPAQGRSFQLEGLGLERVVMHSMLTHRLKKKAYFRSIHAGLRPGGTLYALEPIRGHAEPRDECSHLKTVDELVAIAAWSDFDLLGTVDLGRFTLLKFRAR